MRLPIAAFFVGRGDRMRFQRFEALVGASAARRIAGASVLVAGIGGVGSFVCEALACSGIGTLVLVDPDVVDWSNLNRQLWALTSTVGQPKIEVAARRLSDINPAMVLHPLGLRITAANVGEAFRFPLDFVIDAVDDLEAKVALIREAKTRGIPVASAMGFAKKRHPERVRIGTLADTSVCPLAKVLRQRLRKEAMDLDLPVVWSDEMPQSAETPTQGLPSSATVPAVAGLMLASIVLNRLSEAAQEEQP